MTRNDGYKLRVDLEDNNGDKVYAEYSIFRVNGEADKYRLKIGGYSGTAGNIFFINVQNIYKLSFAVHLEILIIQIADKVNSFIRF